MFSLFFFLCCAHHFVGWPISEEQLQEAVVHSGVLDVRDYFLEPDFRAECERLIPNVDEVEAKDCRQAFLYLKHNFSLSS